VKKNYFLIIAGILIILVIGILVYGIFFQKKPSTQTQNEVNEQNTTGPAQAISIEVADPNGEEKVSNIPVEFMQAGNIAQEQ